jgi:hypothetical protein
VQSAQTYCASRPLARSRGAASNLTDEETRRVAAYVWAIAHVRGEPWLGGHRTRMIFIEGGVSRPSWPWEPHKTSIASES